MKTYNETKKKCLKTIITEQHATTLNDFSTYWIVLCVKTMIYYCLGGEKKDLCCNWKKNHKKNCRQGSTQQCEYFCWTTIDVSI